MKIKKIAAVCKARGTAYIWDAADAEGVVRQWIVTGVSAYPVERLPYLTEEHLATIFDLSEKQIEEMNIQHREAESNVNFGDTDEGEIQATEAPVRIISNGDTLMALDVRGETWFINRALMEPILAEHDDAVLFLRRTEGGQAYFAVKAGLLVVGLVCPMREMGYLTDRLRGIANGYRGDGDAGADG